MQEYVALRAGHMEFLIRALDGDPGAPGALPSPALAPLPADVEPLLVREALAFLQRCHLPIEPRKMWPNGGLPRMKLGGKIAAKGLAQPGMALCYWRDAGWGEEVRRGKYETGRFSEDLVAACVALVREWRPTPGPAWVTCIPSLRRPDLAPDFAGRLAQALDLPFVEALHRIEDRAEQRTMANSAQQACNVDGVFAVTDEPLPAGPVLLVDDRVDSRWTLTVAAWLLRTHGAGEVWPLALAVSGHGG